jgi:transcriptional regulator with XRE-family HTH domain
MVGGRPRDVKLRGRLSALRAKGLTLAEIGRQLGMSRQAVHATLKSIGADSVRSVPCCGCGKTIISPGALPQDASRALCLPCLKRKPAATFGQRLKAHRLKKGLTRAELARRAGLSHGANICGYEEDRFLPLPKNRAKLAKALGIPLRQLDKGAPKAKRGRGRPRKKTGEPQSRRPAWPPSQSNRNISSSCAQMLMNERVATGSIRRLFGASFP